MNKLEKIEERLRDTGFFQSFGAYVLVDGQYGSTGKGLAAGMLAEMFHDEVGFVTTNAGPNSGHTSYWDTEKVVLCQLPTFGVIARYAGSEPTIFMNAGAIIDRGRLQMEIEEHKIETFGLFVHPTAAVTSDAGSEHEKSTLVHDIGSTGKGTGAALAAKIMRGPDAVIGGVDNDFMLGGMPLGAAKDAVVFVEVSQGFSLSLNAGGMYPYCTSRDCTVAQALSDANIHPNDLRQTMMVVRTYPIRVAGNSGPCFDDQKELTWEELGQEPEITTVTKKVRRVFTFSVEQFKAAVACNQPEHIFLNFVNYLSPDSVEAFVQNNILKPYREIMKADPLSVILGFGATVDDVMLYEGAAE